jgi:hypothetical protein
MSNSQPTNILSPKNIQVKINFNQALKNLDNNQALKNLDNNQALKNLDNKLLSNLQQIKNINKINDKLKEILNKVYEIIYKYTFDFNKTLKSININTVNFEKKRKLLSPVIKIINEVKEEIDNLEKKINKNSNSILQNSNSILQIEIKYKINNLNNLLIKFSGILKKKLNKNINYYKSEINKYIKNITTGFTRNSNFRETKYKEIVNEKLELAKDIQLLQILLINQNNSFPNLIGYDLDYFATDHDCEFIKKYKHLLINGHTIKTLNKLYKYLKDKNIKILGEPKIFNHQPNETKNKIKRQLKLINEIKEKYKYDIEKLPVLRPEKKKELENNGINVEKISQDIINQQSIIQHIYNTTTNIVDKQLELITFKLEYEKNESLYCNKKKNIKTKEYKNKIHKYVLLGKKLAQEITGNKSNLFSKLYKKPITTLSQLGKNTSNYNLFKRYIGATEKRNKSSYFSKPLNINKYYFNYF